MVNGEDDDEAAAPTGTPGAGACLACRGSGRVISGLGGEPHQVDCPWCRGTGRRIPGIDAQENPSELATQTPGPSHP
jgi:DnaJ-class molecular chaperone